MSDNDDFMMDDGDDEDYGFDYEDDDGADEAGADVENTYYTAKSLKTEKPQEAIAAFEALVKQEADDAGPGEWGFKALKQLTKLTFRQKRFDVALAYYTQLLTYIKSAVTRNVAEKAINGILDYVSASPDIDLATMQQFYEATLVSLAESKNERLRTKTNVKLAKLWLDRKEYAQLTKSVRELHASVAPSPDENDSEAIDNTRGTLLLEIYALEIQMHTEMKNNQKLRQIYEATTQVRSAIPHPRISGVIKECGGKMFMYEKAWAKAQVAFFDSFRNYDEAGSPQRIVVLKYLVLAHMLMGSKINPFDSQETKPYASHTEILPMTNLVRAYQENNVHEAEKVLRENRKNIMDDPFIASHLADVLRSLRTQWIVDVIRSYSAITIPSFAKQLGIADVDMESILTTLIMDGKINGKIDQVTQRLTLDKRAAVDARRYGALHSWSSELDSLHQKSMAKSLKCGPIGMQGNMTPYDMGMDI
ncbi:uncharacterized protein L969DRAFT_604511 [Mixia osmundae IAM 14324]|uniref:COP9 signalosome complex subunit 2 n=1 Tax=Mixia osmundae (strain CBS 9802 / IAM 14324 / JCM 22182 / KY 12970) TaxID=764103 RepID=G7E3Q8_MIXOS|nr:uncharacterized protein L969DRAFT_604511 [Mixia osmundae IAM 14324]KEI41872.1 hypothetical protein L969DRAFT_604511 [Mixia osmundae IAM 14324]GAA97468.1 hypothetical protein E5Q_04147 [Mixia osmundae IAM 14324]